MDGRPASAVAAGLSLVIPAYNEAAGIHQAIEEADRALAELASDYEILVVDDGSRDETARQVEAAAQTRPRVRLLRHSANRGYGAALRTGFEAARFDRIAFTDADCQFDLRDLAGLISLTDRAPLAVGYRMDRQDSWTRGFYSYGYNLLVRHLLGTRVRDCDCALKVFRRDALARLLPQTRRFFVNAEMLTRARQQGLSVGEVGVRHRPRLHGASKVSLADIPRTLATLLPFWWSAVLFPGPGAGPSRPVTSVFWNPLAFGAVLVAAALLFLSRLHGPLLEPDEARCAEIPRQMLQEGRWTAPLCELPYRLRTPLLYWLVMAAYAGFGVHDWAARLVPCAAAFLAVLATYLWGRRTVGARAAFAGAIMLCLSVRFVYLGRMLSVDSLLCLWVVVAWAAAHHAVRDRTLARPWWLLSAAGCGLGLLTIGPAALALVTVPVLAMQALDPRTAPPRPGAWISYLAVALLTAGSWYVGLAVKDQASALEFVRTDNVVLLAQPANQKEPVSYFVPAVLLGTLPWSFLLPALVRFLGRRSMTVAARRPGGLGMFVLAFLWCVGFSWAAGGLRPGSVLPALPPLALVLGCYLDAALPRRLLQPLGAPSVQRLGRLAYRATLLVLAVGLAGSFLAVSLGLQKPLSGGLVAAGCAVGLLLMLHTGSSRRAGLSWGLCGGVTLLLLYTAVHQVLPGYERRFSLREQVRPQRPVTLDPAVPIVCYPRRWDSVSFYLRRDDVRVYSAERRSQLMADLRKQPSTLLFVATPDPDSRALHDLLRDLPASLEFVPRAQHGMVTAGVVQPRAEVPPTILARRE